MECSKYIDLSQNETHHSSPKDFNGTHYPFDIYTNKTFLILLTVLAVLMFIENLLIILVIVRTRVLQTTSNIFVLSLATVYLIISINQIVGYFAQIVTSLCINSATGGIVYLISVSFNILSIVKMSFIAFERYLFISKPMFYKARISHRCVLLIMEVSWIVAILNLFGMFIVFFRHGIHQPVTATPLVDYTLYLCWVFYPLCILIVFVAYGKICLLALSQRKSVTPGNNGIFTTNHSMAMSSGTVHYSHGLRMRPPIQTRTVLKTIRYFSIAFGLFLMTTLPGFIVYTIIFKQRVFTATLFNISRMIQLYSGLHFIALVCMDSLFRKAFKKLLCLKNIE